jgi:hypothetical protein
VFENRTLGNLCDKLGDLTRLSGVFSDDRVGDLAGSYFRKNISVKLFWTAGKTLLKNCENSYLNFM